MTELGNVVKGSSFSMEKHIFSCQAYRQEEGTWVRLQKLFIDNQFDSMKTANFSKVKIKGTKGHQSTYLVKLTINNKDYFYSMSQELQLQWLTHVVTSRVQQQGKGSPQHAEYVNVCSGYVYRKGFLGDWEKCFVMITQDGLTIAREEKGKVEAEIQSVKEIWTRFEIEKIDGAFYFVFKLRNFFKEEFGVPVEMVSKWTKAFYSLIDFD